MKKYAIIAVLLAGCQGAAEKPYTWGDAVKELSDSYCVMLSHCYGLSQTNIDWCSEHSQFHLCHDADCSQPINQDYQEHVMTGCQAAMDKATPDSVECFAAYQFGLLPDECNKVFDQAPENE